MAVAAAEGYLDVIQKQYSFIKQIGEGAFGKVHLVQDIKDEKQYVVKVIQGRNREENELAKKEIQFLKTIRHPNIVLYKDDFEIQGGMIVVMEYCSGGDLSKIVKSRGPARHFFEESQVIVWFLQICDALQYLHERNILHRDLKPANLFLTHENVIKIGDFGVSRQLVSAVDHATTIVGTPLYLSPEIIRQQPYNHKSDVWSIGCCMYELMSFQQAINPMVVYLTKKWEVKPMERHYNAELCAIVENMLTIDQNDRPSIANILDTPFMKEEKDKVLQRGNPVGGTLPRVSTSNVGKSPVFYRRSTGEGTSFGEPAAELQESLKRSAISLDSDFERTCVKVELEDVFPFEATMKNSVSEDETVLSSASVQVKRPPAERLREFGYEFNEKQELKDINTGKEFQYNVHDDPSENEKRYQDIATAVTDYVGDLLETNLKMNRITLPVDCAQGEPHTFIFATPDFLTNKDKLLILVNGSGNIRAGVWSRKVVIQESIEVGSQIPAVKQAIDEGYAVVILNQNETYIKVDGVACRVRGNYDSLTHALYVWDEIVIKNTQVRRIAFLTHSAGGALVVQLAIDREEYFKRLVFGVAFCNCNYEHVIKRATPSLVEFFKSNSRNWLVSKKPLNECLTRTGIFSSQRDLRRVSAGDERPEWTIVRAMDAAFQYLQEKYQKHAKQFPALTHRAP